MTRTEVEDLAQPALVTTAAPEHFTALKPTDEDQRIRRRDVKPLAVHLFAWDLKVGPQPGGDRVTRFHHPDPLPFIVLTPDEIAGGAHQPLEDLREMGGVQDDQSHPLQHPLLDAGDNFITYLGMRHVPPPGEYIGLCQHGLAETMFRLIQRCYTHHHPLRAQMIRNWGVQAAGIQGPHFFVRLLVPIFVPDCYVDRHRFTSHLTGIPLFAALARMASHSLAMRSPTSGGEGLGMRPLRTSRNCSHTPSDGGTGIGIGGWSPVYCTPRVSPQIPVCRIAFSQNT